MAKASSKSTAKTGGTAKTNDAVKNFEQRLERLEFLGEQIRKTDIPLDEALAAFEEGIKLAKTLEKDLDSIESRIEILTNSASTDGSSDSAEETPELDLFELEG